jgi:glucose-1-phosphate thymidylyltransferase
MEIAKALILAGGGRDGRPWPSGPAGAKHLFPVANRPILFHNLEALSAAGVLEAMILAEPDAGAAIHQAVGDGRELGLSIGYADWKSAVGLGGALAAARDFVGDEPVLVQQGDALLRERMHGYISAFARERLDALALRLQRPAARLPRAPTPGYLLSPRGVSILAAGSHTAVDPIAGVRAHGGRVRVERVDGCLPCHGDLAALLDGNRRMLEGLVGAVDPSSLDDCNVQGAVDVHPTAQIKGTLLRGPVIIGAGARVSDAYIGPYTSIGAGVIIEGAEIEHSIVLPEAELRFVGTRLESSVIGRGARIVRGFELPGAIRVSIGDGAEVILR